MELKTYEIYYSHSYTVSRTVVKANSRHEAIQVFHKKYPRRYYEITGLWEVKE